MKIPLLLTLAGFAISIVVPGLAQEQNKVDPLMKYKFVVILKRYNLTPTDINTCTASVTQEDVAKVKELAVQGYR